MIGGDGGRGIPNAEQSPRPSCYAARGGSSSGGNYWGNYQCQGSEVAE